MGNTFLLKFSGLLSPEKGSILSNIKREDLPSVVFLLAFLVLPTIWIPVYIVAYRSYRAIKEANNPISIWVFPGCRHPCCSRNDCSVN